MLLDAPTTSSARLDGPPPTPKLKKASHDGFADLFDKFLTRFPERHQLLMLNTAQIPYPEWFSLTFMAMMAVMFLPRQFHIMVIENCRESHIRDAMWRFPAYLFLITLFVIPNAMAGLLHNNGATGNADFFVLQLPLETGQPWLALIVFIGGVSASAGMVMVESVALATMILNHLLVPVILRLYSGAASLSRLLIYLKRGSIVAVIMLGYIYYRFLGESAALVNIGLISFMAAAQFAPAIIGLLARLALMLAQIETGLFPPCDPGAWICSPQWCGYFLTCTYSIKRR